MALVQQIENLSAQGNELADVTNTAWQAAHRRLQIEDAKFAEQLAGDAVPPIVNVMGQQVVKLDAKTKTASWDTPHDAKRTAEYTDKGKPRNKKKATTSEEEKDEKQQ